MMKMKKFATYIACLLLAAAAACTDDPTGNAGSDAGAGTADGEFTLSFGVQFPETVTAISRAWSETPAYDNLDLYCIVFQDNGNPSANFLTQVAKAVHAPENAIGPDEKNRLLIPFTVNLAATEEKAVIHFIAIDKSLSDAENPLKHIEYGPENVIIPRMKTSGGHDAYWQRIVLGCPIMSANREQIEKLVSKFSPVPMIRNFAKITVECADEVGFRLRGFCVINQINSGTIAPYAEAIGFPTFVKEADPDDPLNYREPYTYDEMTALPYAGVRANGWEIGNQEVPEDDDAGEHYSLLPKYVYERPFSTTLHTYIIVAGEYLGGGTQEPSGKVTYYKLDLGQANERGLFVFCNLLRNFNYRVVITSVEADGYPTTEAAAKGQIYNNNISAAVETQHLLNISDGHEMMYVNFTSKVIVTREDVDLLYRYFELTDNTIDPDDQRFDWVEWADYEVGCIAGDVIARAVKTENLEDKIYQGTTPVNRTWEHIVITPNELGPELKIQNVTLYRKRNVGKTKSGLSRTITLYLREPWSLSSIDVFGGGAFDVRPTDPSFEYPEDYKGPRPPMEGEVSHRSGQQLTIFFDLPPGLPKAMFPLEFVLESDRQNIENDKVGTIAVRSAPSMFDGVDDYRIQYIKTVTWEEYDPDNEANYNASGTYTGNIVRCRFLTITDLESFDDINNSYTQVIIDNPYFNRAIADFERNQPE